MQRFDWRVILHDSLDSTQDELRRRLSDGEDIDGLVIRAAEQTQGRGQRRRDWSSDRGGSWQSAALKGHALPASSLFIAIGIARALNSEAGESVYRLKWPNDILLHGTSKVAGILCEYTSGYLLTGVGVNVDNQPPPGKAAVTGVSLERVNALVLEGIQAGWLLMHLQPGSLADAWAELDCLHGKLLRYRRAGVVHSGVAAGVDAAGRLRLQTGDGGLIVDSAVSLVPDEG